MLYKQAYKGRPKNRPQSKTVKFGQIGSTPKRVQLSERKASEQQLNEQSEQMLNEQLLNE